MKKAFSPRSDSLAAKVLAFLDKVEGPITLATIATQWGGDAKSNGNKLKAAIQAGALEVVEADGDVAFQLATKVAPKKRKAPARATQTRGGVSRKKPEPVEEDAEEVSEQLKFATFSDGDISFSGAPVAEDGSVMLTEDHQHQLVQHIMRHAAAQLFA